MLAVVIALAFCILIVLGGIGYKAIAQRRENAMLSAIAQTIGKPAPQAVSLLNALGYRVVTVEQKLYGAPHTKKDYDIMLVTNNGVVVEGTTD